MPKTTKHYLILLNVISCTASLLCIPLNSDSGESLFITQSVTKAVRTERRDGSTKRPESISDDSEGVANSRSKNEGNRYEEGSEGQHVVCPKGQKRIHYFPPQKATFPFLLKLHRRQHLPRKKHQILEVAFIHVIYLCICVISFYNYILYLMKCF